MKSIAIDRLQNIFGFSDFIEDQWQIIKEVLYNNSILVIKQTGYGKSLCYQLPATYFDGVTLVFSPLIALMRDQVNFLNKKGIKAACINSDNSMDDNRKIIDDAINNRIKLLYIAPERQETFSWIEIISKLDVSMIVIDEAHCISVWGHDFRPSYKKITKTIAKFKNIPIMALTATANHRTELDIKEQIGDVKIVRGSLLRNNLRLNVIRTRNKSEKIMYIKHIIHRMEGIGIIFTGTISDAEEISNILNQSGISSTYYHSKIINRSEIEKEVINNRYKCIVSTNAFGMGIDKSDFRFIIHFQFPASTLHYYQEIGRAGRDNKAAEIVLLWEYADRYLQEYFIYSSKPPITQYEKVIDYLEANPRSLRFKIAISLDIEENIIKNILNDLDDQGIIIKNYEYKDLPINYEFIEKIESTDSFEQSIIEILDRPMSLHKISKILLGDTKNNSKEKTMYYLNKLHKKGAIRKIEGKKTSIFYSIKDSKFNITTIDEIREYKIKQLEQMIKYLNTDECRMKFLCNQLGDNVVDDCGNCDNCTGKPLIADNCEYISCDYNKERNEYQTINLVYPSEKNKDISERKFKLVDGTIIDLDGDGAITAISNLQNNIDLLVVLPDNDINFCEQLGVRMNIPVIFMKGKRIKYRNWYNKKQIASKFYVEDTDLISGRIILFDMDVNTGNTVKQVGRYLSKLGADIIFPVFLKSNPNQSVYQ